MKGGLHFAQYLPSFMDGQLLSGPLRLCLCEQTRGAAGESNDFCALAGILGVALQFFLVAQHLAVKFGNHLVNGCVQVGAGRFGKQVHALGVQGAFGALTVFFLVFFDLEGHLGSNDFIKVGQHFVQFFGDVGLDGEGDFNMVSADGQLHVALQIKPNWVMRMLSHSLAAKVEGHAKVSPLSLRRIVQAFASASFSCRRFPIKYSLEEMFLSGARNVMINRRQFSQSASAFLLAGAAPMARAQSDKIVLGQSAPFTGPSAQIGIQFNAGAKLAFEQFNAAGGLAGRMIELRALDDGYEPDRCVVNTHQFIDEDVFALFGFVGTATSVLAMPLAVRAKLPFFGPLTGAMALRQPLNRYVFHVRASYNDETELIVKQLTTLGLKKIAVFYQADAYGRAGLDGVKLALGALSLQPVAEATVERNSVDVARAVSTINAAKPEAVVQISAYNSCAAYIRAARAAGYGGLFYNVSFVGTQALADALGPQGAGVVVTQVVPSPYAPSRPITREFLAAIKRGGSTVQPNFGSMEGYIAAKVFLEGLLRAGPRLSRESLMAGLETMTEYSLGGFRVSLSRTDHVASNLVETSLLTGDGRVRS